MAVQLNQRGFAVYLPLTWASPAGSRGTRERPYFPSYLFVRLDLQLVGLDVIRWTPGVRGVVEANGELVWVSESFMAELQRWLRRVPAISELGHESAWHAEALGLSDGQLQGYEGVVNPRLPGTQRAQLLLACVYQAFTRQISTPQPPAESPDEPGGRKPSGGPGLPQLSRRSDS